MNEDPRKTGLKNGLRQLNIEQINKVLSWPHEMVFDEFNYADGKFCPLSVGVGLPETMVNPTHEKVFDALIKMGYKVYNTKGIKGDFYTTNRKNDLIEAAKEVIAEKENKRCKDSEQMRSPYTPTGLRDLHDKCVKNIMMSKLHPNIKAIAIAKLI